MSTEHAIVGATYRVTEFFRPAPRYRGTYVDTYWRVQGVHARGRGQQVQLEQIGNRQLRSMPMADFTRNATLCEGTTP